MYLHRGFCSKSFDHTIMKKEKVIMNRLFKRLYRQIKIDCKCSRSQRSDVHHACQ